MATHKFILSARVAEREETADGSPAWVIDGLDPRTSVKVAFLVTSLAQHLSPERAVTLRPGTDRDFTVCAGGEVYKALEPVLELAQKNSRLRIELDLGSNWTLERIKVDFPSRDPVRSAAFPTPC